MRRVKRDEEVVCYADVGCFRDEGPFDYLDMLPSPPEEVGTKILLYTRDARRHLAEQSGLPKVPSLHCRENRDLSQVLDYNNASAVAESNFNASLPVKIIIHGFGSTCLRLWAREMRVSFLAVVSHCFTIPLPHLGFRNRVWQEGDVCPPSLFDDKSRFPHHHVAYNMAAQSRGSGCRSALFKSDDTHGRRRRAVQLHCALPPAR